MSLDRFQMALEIIEDLEPYHADLAPRIARKALRFPAGPVVAASEPKPPVEEEPEPEPEPASPSPPVVHHGRPYVPIMVPEPEPEVDDEPEPIDLDEIDAELDAEEASEPTPEPAAFTSNSQRALEIIRRVGEIKPSELRERLERGRSVTERAVTPLIERGLILAEGSRGGRVYKRLPQDKPTMPDEPPASENGAGGGLAVLTRQPTEEVKPQHGPVRREQPGTDEGRVFEAVSYRQGSIVEIARRLEMHVDRVAIVIRKLERDGDVQAKSNGQRVVWSRA